MDPAESILSMLDYSIDSHVESEFGLPFDMNLGFDDVFNNDFFSSNENLITDVLNDDLLDSLDYGNTSDNDPLLQSLINSKSLLPRSKKFLAKNSTTSILNNSIGSSSKTQNTPKVYINKPKPSGEGVSILVKKKKVKKRSLLQSKRPLCTEISGAIFSSNLSDTSPYWYATIDHDYCLKTQCKMPNHSSINESQKFAKTDTITEASNDLDDILEGFISDDVMLNELPNCLQDLVDLDNQLALNCDDILHGLNDGILFICFRVCTCIN